MKNKYVFILLIFVLLIGTFGACTREGAQKPINNRQLRDDEINNRRLRDDEINNRPLRDAEMRNRPDTVLPDQNNDTEERMIEKINNIPEVDATSVILSDRNAYVAVRLKDGVNNSTRLNLLETEIKNIVKREDPKVANVYFSAEEGTIGKLRKYENENIRNGTLIPEIESLFKSPIKNMTGPGTDM
ncbi:YhcN/YlaJ family sporulation lipoprotein [Anaeromicrobium sediminis]|uniref:Sporulation protein n=1 Tax=Anaeromicrobium sediminis TaxID=1478221 RepID=A0A267MK53_9FIRM|nr:YhcN/YlaJ family sporulation lipoprotein [Anaeromicrobium sediminis]PAB59964.1 hypothetical protein CCE28_08405 [Anaeromicrobium sediminis]